MPAALGPRFVLEAGFLVLLAVVVGFADLSPALIVLVMLVGWLLVAAIEYFAWRQAQPVPLSPLAGGPGGAVEEEVSEPGPVVHEEVAEAAPPTPPSPPEPVPEEETIVERQPEPTRERAAEPEREEPEAGTTSGFADATEEKRVLHRLEPLQPRPRRKWILFGPYVRPEAPSEGDREEEH
jgi:hypothetical protein